MTGFYAIVLKAGPAILLVIAAINFLGSLGMIAHMPGGQGLLFGLSAALSSTMIPFIAASVLLRFDQWLMSVAGGARV